MIPKVLCVDDEPNVLAGYQRNLRKQFTLEGAGSGHEALRKLERDGPFAVIVADMQMPEMNGIELLQKVRVRWPDTVRIMLTGNADQPTAVSAVNHGSVYRFLNKPCSPETLATTLDAAIRQYRLTLTEREVLEQTLNGSVKVLTDILATVDPDSCGRAEILREHMAAFLESMGVPPRWEYDVAALLSQIGFVAVPASVHHKIRNHEPLTDVEKEVVRRVPQIGSELLAKIPRFEGVANIILHQAKNFDGSGFPCDGATGEDIPLGARILKVLGDLQTLEQKGMARGVALLELQARPGAYDPRVLDAAFKCFDYSPAVSTLESAKPALCPVADLHPGQLLLADVMTTDGTLIVSAGTRLTAVMLEKIRNSGRINGVQEPICVAG